MGLNKTNTNSNAFYLFQGNVIKSSDKENSDLTKNGKFYEKFSSLSGMLKEIKVVDGYEKNKDLSITLIDAGEEYTVYFTVGSGYYKSFARTFPNVVITREVELVPVHKVEDKKDKVSLLIKQNDVFLKRYYTIDNMEDMPVAVPVEVNGEVIYDYKEQNDFLNNLMINKVKAEAIPF